MGDAKYTSILKSIRYKFALKRCDEVRDIVRKIVMGVLRNDGVDYGKKRVSLKRRMLRAIHDEGYLDSLLRRL